LAQDLNLVAVSGGVCRSTAGEPLQSQITIITGITVR
jgi:hypothetical protein